MRLGSGPAVLVVDVGGTAMKHGVLDAEGELVEVAEEPTPLGADRAAAIVERIGELARARRGAVERVSVALPGTVDAERGVGVLSENLDWQDVPFRALLEEACGVPVSVLHDIQAAGLAERHDGALRGERDAALLVVGTGIAAALVVDGHLLRARGYAGEVGHVVVDPAGPACACGGAGCVEAIGSAAAMARAYAERTDTAVDGAREVLERAQGGDAVAEEVWREGVGALAHAVLVLQAVVGPEVVAVAGGLSAAGDALLVPLRQEVERRRTIQPAPRIVLAAAGVHAGLRGAAIHGRSA